MVKDNINKPNPQHYKLELKSVPVVIDGKEVVVDRLQLETRHILKDVVNDANMTHEQASWYWSMGKRYFRLCKKHDESTSDIKKIIQEATFLLSSILGKEYKARLLDENGNDLLNERVEVDKVEFRNDKQESGVTRDVRVERGTHEILEKLCKHLGVNTYILANLMITRGIISLIDVIEDEVLSEDEVLHVNGMHAALEKHTERLIGFNEFKDFVESQFENLKKE